MRVWCLELKDEEGDEGFDNGLAFLELWLDKSFLLNL